MNRNITAGDLDFIYQLYMHPAVNPFLLYEKMEQAAFMPIYADLLAKNIVFVFEVNGERAGMFKWIPQQYRNHHTVYLGGLAIHPGFAGKGYGSLMMTEIIEKGRLMNSKRIELSVATSNRKAIRLYEKAGFVKEGILRKYTHLVSEDRFIDEVMMSYLYE
jgi:putative acetyltransferase